ncbi:MAG: hypothetical protein ABI253_07745 [Mycobacterium sp.]
MTPPWPIPPPVQPHRRPVVALTALTALLAVAALIVSVAALNKSAGSATPAYTAAQKAAAETQLCDRYKLAGGAMHIATSAPDGDVAIARVSLTNGAVILETAAASPVLDSKYRDAARALATAYQTQLAMGLTATTEQYQSAMDDTNAKDRVMQDLFGG